MRYANFSELIYSEVQFCFHTSSVESSHIQSLRLRGERGNHTIYFCELLRVTVRVNPGAMRGYVRQ